MHIYSHTNNCSRRIFSSIQHAQNASVQKTRIKFKRMNVIKMNMLRKPKSDRNERNTEIEGEKRTKISKMKFQQSEESERRNGNLC